MEEYQGAYLDKLNILQECKKRLILTDFENYPTLSKEQEISFLTSKGLICEEEYSDAVFAPIFIVDKKENIAYPIVFYKFGFEEKKIFKKGYPFFNYLAFYQLESLKINLNDLNKNDDISSYVISIQSKIELVGLKDRLEVRRVFCILSDSILLYSQSFNALLDIFTDKEIPTRYKGFYKDIQVPEVERIVEEKSSRGYFSLYQKANERLRIYKSSKVTYDGEEIKNDYLYKTLVNLLMQGLSVVIVSKDKEREEELFDFLSMYHLKSLSYDLASYDPKSIKKTIELNFDEYPADFKQKDIFLRNNERNYLMLGEEKYKLIEPLYSRLSDDLSKVLIEATKRKVKELEFDVRFYSDEDYRKDEPLLRHLLQFNSIRNSYLQDHVFNGLSLSSKRENYYELVGLIQRLIQEIKDFKNILIDKKVKNLNNEDFNNFVDFVNHKEDIDIINDYNGFPKKYFKIDDPEDPDYKIKDIKNAYQALSSAKLLVNNLFNESIYSMDLDKTLSLYYGGNRSDKKKVEKLIASHIKDVKKNNIPTCIELLNSYLTVNKNLNDILPGYIKTYGETIANMNGAVEIESNIKYLKRFSLRSKVNPYLSVENPYIKRCIKEKAYRTQIVGNYYEAYQLYLSIKDDLNALTGMFLYNPIKYIELNFDDLLNLLQKKSVGSYEEFYEYATLMSDLDNASTLMQLTIRKYKINKEKLTDFPYEFLLSLFKSRLALKDKHFISKQEEYDEAKSNYISMLNEFDKINAYKNYDNIINLIRDKVASYFFADKLLRTNYYIKNGENLTESIAESYQVYNSYTPIALTTCSEAYIADTSLFDVVIIFSPGEYSAIQLTNALRIANNVLFLEKVGETDVRIQGYPEVLLSNQTLFAKRLHLDRIPPSLLELLETKCDELGYELILNHPYYPLVMKKKELDHPEYALLLDCMIEEGLRSQSYSNLREFLIRNYNLKLVPIDSIEFLTDPENDLNKFIKSNEKQ